MQNPDSRGGLPRSTLLMCTALLATACSSTSRSMFISVNPPQAALYINGEPVGNGDKRPHTLSFAESERIYVQAAAPDFEPRIDWFTLQQLDEMIDRNLDILISLRQR